MVTISTLSGETLKYTHFPRITINFTYFLDLLPKAIRRKGQAGADDFEIPKMHLMVSVLILISG